MRSVRMLAAALAVFAVAGLAMAMDSDIRELKARLAAQEARMADQDARMNDLQAKIASGMGRGGEAEVTADNLLSLQKNAKVTIGGLVTTKYTFTDAKVNGHYAGFNENWDEVYNAAYGRTMKSRTGDFVLGDAELSMRIDVNEYFDAFMNLNLQGSNGVDDYIADVYYVRWKNICESGFGLKVGRDALVFGADGVGELGSYAAGSGDGAGEIDWMYTEGVLGGSVVPLHNVWDLSSVTQITPYWEGLDGKLSFELSFMQNVYEDTVYASAFEDGANYRRGKKFRSRNYGLGTMSARVRYSPIEDLNFTLSAANYRSNGSDERGDARGQFKKNNSVYGLAVSYRPSAFNRLNLWAQWVYGNNVHFYRDLDSHAINFGGSFDLTDSLTFFAQGDYLRSKYSWADNNEKGTAWAFYTGLQYSLAYGVSLEAGWKYEFIKLKEQGRRVGKTTANTLYAILGFEF